MSISKFAFPTTIHFGPGASGLVADYLKSIAVERPLIVTDKALSQLPVASKFAQALSDSGLSVQTFAGIWGNPMASMVGGGVAAFRAHGADAVIGFGGGAALDVAELVAMMATNAGDDVLEYAWDHPHVRPILNDLPPLVALPTTSGTGSEVGRSSVVSDDTTHVKKIVFNPKLLAKVVFADPALTLELPRHVTAATGMDALTDTVESYLSPAYHPLCDGIALEGVRIAARALPVAVREPSNIAARSDMMMASMMGAIAFQKDLGAVHSCAHALSTVADLHHGLANGIMIDHVMRFNAEAAPAKMAELARVAGTPGVSAMNEREAGAAFIDWLRELKREIGIPARLAEAGVKHAQVDALVAVAIDDICHQTNPRKCTREDFAKIFAEAI